MSGRSDEETLFIERTERLHLSDTEIGATVRARSGPEAADEVDPADLPRITVDTGGEAGIAPAHAPHPDLALVSTIGEGGMGRVHLAHQRSLGRDVAVKTLKGDATAAVGRTLLREARLTGQLEHPGVIPVHALGVDDKGRPMLVMKRVDGVDLHTWLRGEAQTGERLVECLEALMQVCRTCEFAHSHGIVHRDIKPANIMLGGFGEVYLLDWGIATRMDMAAGTEGIVGTPIYMAPEMVLGLAVDARTDVYLLGATLHVILSGRARHDGETMMDVTRAATLSEPVSYGPDVPEELARLCNRATAKNPADRPRSASEMREAISLFLRHRAARAIADAARERLATLEILLRAPTLPAEEIARAYRLVAEARFGLAQSLEQHPTDSGAVAAARRCQLAAVELELRQGHVESAEALYRELDEPDASLDARIVELRARDQANAKERARLERLDRDLDPTQHANHRTLPLVALGAVFVFMAAYVTAGPSKLTPGSTVAAIAIAIVMVSSGVAALWRTVFSSAFNRRAVLMIYIGLAVSLVNRLGGLAVGRPVAQTLTNDLLALAAVMACGTALLLRDLWPCTIIVGAGLVTALLAPNIAEPAFAVSMSLNLAAGAVILRRARRA